MTKPTKPTKPPRISTLNAIRHGAYSNIGLLPGEDRDDFSKHVLRVYEEFKPSGALELDAVKELALLLWRKDHLGVYQRAEVARKNWGPHFKDKDDPSFDLDEALEMAVMKTLEMAVIKKSIEMERP